MVVGVKIARGFKMAVGVSIVVSGRIPVGDNRCSSSNSGWQSV